MIRPWRRDFPRKRTQWAGGVAIAIANEDVKKGLAKLNGRIVGVPESADPFHNAPVVLLFAAKKSPKEKVDGAAMAENMPLAAHALGLGAC